MDWIASKTHEILAKVEDVAKDTARKVVDYQVPEGAHPLLSDGHRFLSNSVQRALEQSNGNYCDSRNGRFGGQSSDASAEAQRQAFDRDTEKLLQKFLYDQYSLINCPPLEEISVKYPEIIGEYSANVDALTTVDQVHLDDFGDALGGLYLDKIQDTKFLARRLIYCLLEKDCESKSGVQDNSYLLELPKKLYDELYVVLQTAPDALLDSQKENQEEEGGKNVSESLEWKLHCIDKDILRTERNFSFFEDGSKDYRLRTILMLYDLAHAEVGYVQGMADLLTPIFYAIETSISEDEAKSILIACIKPAEVVDEKASDEDSESSFVTTKSSLPDITLPNALSFRIILIYWVFERFLHGPETVALKTRFQYCTNSKSENMEWFNNISPKYHSNFLDSQIGMKTRFHLMQHLLRWLDPVFYQYLLDLDYEESGSNIVKDSGKTAVNPKKDDISILDMENPEQNSFELRELDDEWTEVGSSKPNPRENAPTLAKEHVRPGSAPLTNSNQGALTFFWLYKSLILLFKRDIGPTKDENQADNIEAQNFNSILVVWLNMIYFRQHHTAFPELFVAMGLVGAYIRPMLIPTYPLPRPEKLRKDFIDSETDRNNFGASNLQEVDTVLGKRREHLLKEIFRQGLSFEEFDQQHHSEGSIEILLRCMATLPHRNVNPRTIVRGLWYWYRRMEKILLSESSALRKGLVLNLKKTQKLESVEDKPQASQDPCIDMSLEQALVLITATYRLSD